MATVLSGIALVAGIGSLICFIVVVIQMFQNDETVLAILCVVFCGLGQLIAFVYGWIKSAEWEIKPVMLAWTGCFAVSVLAQVLGMALGAG